MTPDTGTQPIDTARAISAFEGPVVVGSAAERAKATLEAFPDRSNALAAAAANWKLPDIDDDLREWVRLSFQALQHHFPEVAEYVEVTAEALGVDVMTSFTRSHLKVVRGGFVLTPGPAADEGCSTAAGSRQDVHGWIAKNRDNNRESLERQIVVEHVDPDWDGRRAVTVANLGGCMANSSGINSAGFAVVDTAVSVSDAPPGIFRAFLLDGLLARCTTVAEAVAIIEEVPHLGGTATMADASGAVATADLAPGGALIEYASDDGTVQRTNHFPRRVADQEHVRTASGRRNSECRLDAVTETMDRLDTAPDGWPEFRNWLADQMLTHAGPGALCKHSDDKSLTISTTIYGCNPPTMLTSLGPGCVSPWVEWSA